MIYLNSLTLRVFNVLIIWRFKAPNCIIILWYWSFEIKPSIYMPFIIVFLIYILYMAIVILLLKLAKWS